MNKPLNDDQIKLFLEKSGQKSDRSQRLSSITMKEYYELIESKLTYGPNKVSSDELQFVDNFIMAFEITAQDVKYYNLIFICSLTRPSKPD